MHGRVPGLFNAEGAEITEARARVPGLFNAEDAEITETAEALGD